MDNFVAPPDDVNSSTDSAKIVYEEGRKWKNG